MAKDRMAVTCNGRTAFYACMYEDIRQCALDCGWAVSLHGSLASDMDIMAMPWVENAVSFKEMIDKVSKLFKDNDMSSQYVITYNEKPHNRVVATIPIWSDFYLDISTITADVVPKSEYEQLQHKYDLAVAEREANVKGFTEELSRSKAEAIKEFAERVEALVRKRADEAKALRDSETRNPIVEERYNGEYLGALIVLSDIAKLKKEYEEQTNDLI